MGKVADKIKESLFEVLNKSVCSTLDFFKKPHLLMTLNIVSLNILNIILNQLKTLIVAKLNTLLIKDQNSSSLNVNNLSDDQILYYYKIDRNIQNFINSTSKDLNERLTGNIILACENSSYNDNKINSIIESLSTSKTEMTAERYIAIIESENDFNSKIKLSKIDKSIIDKLQGFLPWLIITYVMILKIKEYLTQGEFPSNFRAKYLQNIIRNVASSISKFSNAQTNLSTDNKQINKDISTLLSFLSKMDVIISAALLAYIIYKSNKKQFQIASEESLTENLNTLSCESIESSLSNEEITNSLNLSVLNDSSINVNNILCVKNNDDVIVPHKSFNDKLKDFTCEIDPPKNEPYIIEENLYHDIASGAIIQSTSKEKFRILTKKNDKVNSRSIIATLGKNKKIYSPIDGTILSIDRSNNEIRVIDILDPENTYLNDLLKKTQDLYKRQNSIKFFIKEFFIESWYPVMLKESPLIDASISGSEALRIRYILGGIEKRWEAALKKSNSAKESYEKNAKEITGEDNVKFHGENETLFKIKEDLDKLENSYIKNLKTISNTAINQSKITLPTISEFSLIDFYINLFQKTLSYFDQNDVIKEFRSNLSKIISERYFIESWNLNKLSSKINTYCNNLVTGTFFSTIPNFYTNMMNIYNSSKNIKNVKNYVEDLAKKNKDYTQDEKEQIIDKILFLFEFQLSIIQKVNRKYSSKTNIYSLTNFEGNYIQFFFSSLYKEYYDIPNQLKETYKIIDDLGSTYIPYSIIEKDGEEWRYYGISNRDCADPKVEDENLSPFSKVKDFSDINYWLKYCTFATLVGVTNPLSWSTGLPPPLGPTLLPVIYIPIKAFQLSWGFIVIGISVCGIYPFPWVLIVNYETIWHVPLADPATIIKKQIKTLKEEIKLSLQTFKKKELKTYMDSTEKEINVEKEKEQNLINKKREHRLKKPKRDRSKSNKEDKERYNRELEQWQSEENEYETNIENTRSNAYKLESKHKVIADAYTGTTPIKKAKPDPSLKLCSISNVTNYDNLIDLNTKPSYKNTPDGNIPEISGDPKIIALEKTEEQLDKKFGLLDTLIDSINNLLMPLPISTEPMSANFAFTLKNPKPIIQIKNNLDKNINESILDPIIEKFEPKNEDFNSSKFKEKIDNSIVNYKKFTIALQAALPFIIIQDPFPKYENLKLSNIPWIAFLFSKWTVTGGQCFGFPGFPPIPTN